MLVAAVAALMGGRAVVRAQPAPAEEEAAEAAEPASDPVAPPEAPDDARDEATEPARDPASAEAPAPPEPGAAPALSPGDLADIEAALGADAVEAEADAPAEGTATRVAAAVASLNPDISIITDVALAYFSDDDNLQVGAHDPSETGFNLQQLELAIGSDVDPYFRVDGNLVFSQFGVEIEEIYATTLGLPWNLQARIGQFLTRFGRVNATHPHTWDFVDQPLILGRVFGGEANRGLGAELSYLTPLPWFTEVVASVTDPAGEATARSFYGAEDLGIDSPIDFQTTVAVEQFFALSPDWSLLWGLSWAGGPNPTGPSNRSDIYGTDVFVKYRPITHASNTIVTLQLEWLLRRRQVPDDLLTDHGGLAQLVWRFSKRWGVGLRHEYGAAATDRDGEVGADLLDPEWTEARHRTAANLTFWPTEFSRIRAQASVDAPLWRDEPIYAAVLAFEFNIGAHGAHAF